ncbi:uncharacterized protein EV154DRAFT_504175 [Mucor mucedo]|uniref:uncharacterized protein n=1 Tax=Mucor mucedo TaxID=29922 RepID=UPI00221F2499|nr:uncharacterized protein EV154DRAFT_504175 [Mucor mucedo]KAI7892567.1 hypothetical protein EV154DRAFT_504175 [Mucor mucedo]
MSEIIEYFSLQYECHVCLLQFTELKSLRRHYLSIEGLSYPSSISKFYNKKTKKYVSKTLSKSKELDEKMCTLLNTDWSTRKHIKYKLCAENIRHFSQKFKLL